jgi:alpha-L-fucosidase
MPASASGAGCSDYAQFCALPESERIFSIVSGDRIVAEKLDPATWKPNTYDAPVKLPGIPDSLDGVSMKSPIAGLNGSGPYEPNWDSLLQYEAPEWYQDAKCVFRWMWVGDSIRCGPLIPV